MKRLFLTAIVASSLFLVSLVHAQSRTIFTIGGSYWRSSISVEGADETMSGNLFGPYVNIRMGKFALGSSMYFGTYENKAGNDYYDNSFKIKRTDLNFSLGYSISPNISLFGAYKSLKIKSESESGSYYYYYYGDEEEEDTGTFIGGGASINIPFTNSPLFAFGSLGYLAAQDEYWDDIVPLSFGLGYRTQSRITFMLGYRMEKHLVEDEDVKISGLMATVAYTFK